jgi:uncharacterized protein YndB with AHSA1/START domain
MAGNTIRLHRVLQAPPERVYRAFTEPAAKARWLPPNGYTCNVQRYELSVGGTYAMSFTQFATGQEHGWTGRYVALEPHQRIVYCDRFDDPNMPGEMTVTVTLKSVSCGTELTVVQEGIPEMIPPEMCYLGWQESLLALARLVEMPGGQ